MNHTNSLERLTIGYTLFTGAVALLCWRQMTSPADVLTMRAAVLATVVALWLLHRYFPTRLTHFLRWLFPLTLLSVWYPDTFEFCQLLPNQDHVFASAEQALCGCQPALLFSEALPEKWWSELFNLGYFSYYPMIFLAVLLPLWCKGQWREFTPVSAPREFRRAAFITLGGFTLFYLVYLFLPVAGPQYYFAAIGEASARDGIFPALDFYFRTHAEMLPAPGEDGLFRSLVELMQTGGERPTAAFPSSHVGMSTVLMLLIFRSSRRTAACLLPLYVLLVCATVYIQAHYLVDAVAGFVSGLLFYVALSRWYDLRHPEKSEPKGI